MTIREIGILILIIVLLLSLLGGFALFFLRYKKKLKEDSDNGEYDLDLLYNFKKETEPKIKKRKKILKIVQKVLSISLIVIISALLVFGICDKLGLVKNGSKSIIVVASGSMSRKHPENDYLVKNHLDDQFPTYSIIVIEKVDPSELKQYDTIVYKNDYGKNIIHRIIRIENSASGTQYITKGDANNENDQKIHPENINRPYVHPEDVQGRYTGKYVPLLGSVVLFIQSALGIATMIALIIGLILVDNSKNKVSAIHVARLNLLLEKLSLNEENIQTFNEEDLINMIKNADLTKDNDENKEDFIENHENTENTEQNSEVLNQNNKNDNTND